MLSYYILLINLIFFVIKYIFIPHIFSKYAPEPTECFIYALDRIFFISIAMPASESKGSVTYSGL